MCVHHTHANGKLEEKFHASTEHKPEKNKENRFASARGRREKTTWWKERWTRISHSSIIYRFCTFFPKEWECFCCVDIRRLSNWIANSCCFCFSSRKKNSQTKATLIKKMEIVENSIFDFWKNCRNTNRGTDKGKWREKNRSESAYRKVKSLRAWFVCHSAMISIMIEHSNFRKISFYLYSMAEFLTFALFLSLEESRHLFSHIRFCNGSFSRWCSFTAVSHYFPSIFALSVSHKLLSLSCRCVFFPAGFWLKETERNVHPLF